MKPKVLLTLLAFGLIYAGYSQTVDGESKLRKVSADTLEGWKKGGVISLSMAQTGLIQLGWETQIAFKVNKYITANVNTHLLYDDDINIAVDKNKDGLLEASGPRVQFKEILGVGFS